MRKGLCAHHSRQNSSVAGTASDDVLFGGAYRLFCTIAIDRSVLGTTQRPLSAARGLCVILAMVG